MTNIAVAQTLTYDKIEALLTLFKDVNYTSGTRHHNLLSLEELWDLMDKVWDELECDNITLDSEKISQYYKHPVWLLNGFFVENHGISLQHRRAISDWVNQHQLLKIVDFGGGFGTLARIISQKSEQTFVDIYEPYPSQEGLSLCEGYPNVKFVSKLNSNYDCLISTDVLEHVADPLDLFSKMIKAVRLNGYLIIANHFYPSIKCHLPSTFHFRYSFDQFAIAMGLRKIGLCQNSHAVIYQKTSNRTASWRKIRQMEKKSKILFPLKEFDHQYLSPWRNRSQRLIVDPVGTLEKAKEKWKSKIL